MCYVLVERGDVYVAGRDNHRRQQPDDAATGDPATGDATTGHPATGDTATGHTATGDAATAARRNRSVNIFGFRVTQCLVFLILAK